MMGIKDRNRQGGFYFFSEGALRFFRSRVHDEVYGAGFFVTSEQFDDEAPRYYTVRFARSDGSVTTVGEFQQYASRSGAHAAAGRYAKLHEAGGTLLDDAGQPLDTEVAA